MYVADEFLKIGVFFADNGFVSILKEMAVTTMSLVVSDGVSRQEPVHEGRNTFRTTPDEHVGVIRHQCPCIDLRFRFLCVLAQPVNELFAILIAIDNLPLFDSAYDDVM
jgi:hypothetical protein